MVLFKVFLSETLTAVGIRCADHVTPLYLQKLALTSPTGSGRSVGIVRSRTKATEFFFFIGGTCHPCPVKCNSTDEMENAVLCRCRLGHLEMKITRVISSDVGI